MKRAGHVARMGERRGIYMVLVGKPEGRRPLGKLSCRWESIIEMYLQVMGWGMDWFDLHMDTHRCRTVVNGGMNLWVSQNAENFSTSWEHISPPKGSLLRGFNYTYNSCLN